MRRMRTRISDNAVDETRPPITAMARGWRNSEPLLTPRAVGSIPMAMAIVVMMIGRVRSCAASSKASVWPFPMRSASTACSTSKMEFLAASPISINRPISTGRFNSPAVANKARKAPASDRGNAARMITGLMKLRNNRISTPKINPIPAMIARPKLANNSCMPSASPYSGLETPAGKFFKNGSASTAVLA